MRRTWAIPENAPELMRLARKPVDTLEEPDGIFDFAGFIEVLLVEHGRDLGLSEQQLLDYRSTILPAIQIPGQILNSQLARRLVADLRLR